MLATRPAGASAACRRARLPVCRVRRSGPACPVNVGKPALSSRPRLTPLETGGRFTQPAGDLMPPGARAASLFIPSYVLAHETGSGCDYVLDAAVSLRVRWQQGGWSSLFAFLGSYLVCCIFIWVFCELNVDAIHWVLSCNQMARYVLGYSFLIYIWRLCVTLSCFEGLVCRHACKSPATTRSR